MWNSKGILLFALLPEESQWERKLSDNHEDLADQMMKDSGVRLEMEVSLTRQPEEVWLKLFGGQYMMSLIFRFPLLLASWERAVMGQFTRLCTRTASRYWPSIRSQWTLTCRRSSRRSPLCSSAIVPMFFKNTDLWILMEYCGGGSVSWGWRRRLCQKRRLQQCYHTLKGLEYMHMQRQSWLILGLLCNSQTPWLIRSDWWVGWVAWYIYIDCFVSRSSPPLDGSWWFLNLGITALEMAEGKLLHSDFFGENLFCLDKEAWDFCLVAFVSCNVVADMIAEAAEFRDKVGALGIFGSCSSGTKVTGDSGTMINYSEGSMVQHNTVQGLCLAGPCLR